jgi:hypothetical protein
MGLGLLAGAGAAVVLLADRRAATVGLARGRLDRRVPVALPSAPDHIPAPVMRASAPRVTVSVAVAEGMPAIFTVDVALPPAPLTIAVAHDLSFGPALTLQDLETFDLPADVDVIRMEDLGERPALTTGDATDDAHGILSDAFRRTRESLRGARGFLGVKIQGVMGAVKRASPFWDVSGIQPR